MYFGNPKCAGSPLLSEANTVFLLLQIRDTSVLVRLRPAWEDLRRHLNSKERKRFEVYVCTMAERNYALEMWRLLDPEAQLIDPKQLSAHIVSVNSGKYILLMLTYFPHFPFCSCTLLPRTIHFIYLIQSRSCLPFSSFNLIGHKKSLNRVFQDQKFPREMAMVIDDRLKVWEDIDQPRVQVVPAFLPYRAPLAEV